MLINIASAATAYATGKPASDCRGGSVVSSFEAHHLLPVAQVLQGLRPLMDMAVQEAVLFS